MANKYGYMAKIGADTSGLQEALKSVEADARNISAELRAVNDGLKFDPGNTELLNQKYDLLAKSIENTRQKLEQLKSAEDSVNAAVARGDISVQEQQRYQREIANTESTLRRYQTELNTTQARLNAAADDTQELRVATEEFRDTADEAGEHVIELGDLLKSNILGNLIADGLAAAGDGIKDFISNGIELASNLQEVQNVVDTTFGSGAGRIYAWADAAAESFGMSSLAAQQYNGTLGAMLKSMGLADEAVMQMSTDMVGLAGDMASFYNLDVSAAFDKIRAGISGETEPLKQLGINMSVANLEAYALANGIETAYNKMTQAEQAQLRYNYLMSVTADAQGDFAKTSGSFANQQRILQLNIENLSATIGNELLPYLNEGITFLNDKLPEAAPVIEKIADSFGKLLDFIIDNHEAILTFAAGLTAVQAAANYTKIIDKFKNSLDGLKTAFSGLNLKAAGAVAGIAALVTAVVALKNYIDDAAEEIRIAAPMDGISEGCYKAIDAMHQQREEFEKLTAELKETEATEKAQINNMQNLWKELQNYVDENGRVISSNERASEIIGLLNSNYNLNIGYINGQIQGYGDLASSMDGYIERLRTEARIRNNQPIYDDAIKNVDELQERLSELEKMEENAVAMFSKNEGNIEVQGRYATALSAIKTEKEELEKLIGDYQLVIDDYENLFSENSLHGSDYGIKSVQQMQAEETAKNIEEANKKYAEDQKKATEKLKKEWEDLEYRYNIGEIEDEKQLYIEKRKIWNKYGNESLEDHRKYYVELIKYVKDFNAEQVKAEKEAAEKELEAWEKNTKDVSDKLADAYEDLVDEKEKIRQELLDIDLSETVTTADGKEIEVLTNLDEQIKKIDEYQNSLQRLKNTGISDSLLAEIEAMNYQDGSRQRFIDSLLSLSQDKLDLYYSDWARLQAKSEQVSQDIVADSAEELNNATIAAVKSTFGNMPSAAYAEGVETAQSYLQGITDSMEGINNIDAISGIFTGAFSGSASGKEQKMIPADTKIILNIDQKKYIETTVQDLIDKGQRTGGNPLNL